MRQIIGLFFLLLASCTSVVHTLKYGYLPGGEYQYYSPLSPVDLQGKRYNLIISDERKGNTIRCSQMVLPRDTELEGETGYSYFSNYLRAMIEANNGIVDPKAERTITVRLTGLSGNLRGFTYGHVYGLIEFDVTMADYKKTYCSSMADGDPDAPVGKFSADTRKGAFRKLVSASARKTLEELMSDLARI